MEKKKESIAKDLFVTDIFGNRILVENCFFKHSLLEKIKRDLAKKKNGKG